MALKWIEGFETHRGSGLGWLYDKYPESTLTPQWRSRTGRKQGYGIESYSNSPIMFRTPNLGQHVTWIIGLGVVADNPMTEKLIDIRDAGVGSQLYLQIRNGASNPWYLDVRRDANTLASSGPYVDGQWYYIEMKATIDPAAGSYEVRVDGVTVMQGAAVNTAALGNTNATGIGWEFAGNSSGLICGVDDIYVCDGSGVSSNDFLGDAVVEGILPSADGATEEWSGILNGNPSGDHASLVDEPGSNSNHDGDISYVGTSGDNLTDLWTYTPLGYITGNVRGIMVSTHARLENMGARDMQVRYRDIGAAAAALATHSIDNTLYKHRFVVLENDPVTTAAWTVARINGGQFGVKTLV